MDDEQPLTKVTNLEGDITLLRNLVIQGDGSDVEPGLAPTSSEPEYPTRRAGVKSIVGVVQDM